MKPSYEELEQQLSASIAAERVWETSMMQACGEDGPKSVAEKFAELEAKCAALAAEVYDLKHPGTYLPSKRETPVLDAFLAEVRASATPDKATERELFEGWAMENYCISKCTLEGMRTCDGYRNSTLSGKDYNGMWLQWKAIRAAQLRKGVQS